MMRRGKKSPTVYNIIVYICAHKSGHNFEKKKKVFQILIMNERGTPTLPNLTELWNTYFRVS